MTQIHADAIRSLQRERNEWCSERDLLLQRLQIRSPGPSLLAEAQSPSTRDRFVQFLELVCPFDVKGSQKIRVGGPNDGGYVLIDDFVGAENAISIGIGPDTSWDADIASRNIHVFQFDHSIERSPISNSKLQFFKLRVVTDPKGLDEVSLALILRRPELDRDNNILLKMDIEGDEWDLIDLTLEDQLVRCRQMIIEFHWTQNFMSEPWAVRAIRVMHKLNKHHAVVHLHGNNAGGFTVLGGIPFPNVFEITFLRRDDRVFSKNNSLWPTTLDAPNEPGMADLYLGTLRYT